MVLLLVVGKLVAGKEVIVGQGDVVGYHVSVGYQVLDEGT